jgi:hypothetical protein
LQDIDFLHIVCDVENVCRLADGNQYETLQLPNIELSENITLSMISLTNNMLKDIQYANMGLFTTYNLQFSSLLL